MSVGTGGRRQALQTEDRADGATDVCGKHLRKETSHGPVDGFSWGGTVSGAAGGRPGGGECGGGRGEVSRRGVAPGLPFFWLKGDASPSADRPSACDRARALDGSWETAGHTQDKMRRVLGAGAAPGLHAGAPGSTWGLRRPGPASRLGRAWFLLRQAQGQQDNEVLDKPSVSSCPLVPPRCPSGQWSRATDSHHGAVHGHAFAALRGRHGILSSAGAVLLLSQGFPGSG